MKAIWHYLCAVILLAALLPTASARAEAEVTVGSKAFTENVILGEMITQVLRSAGLKAEHRAELGGTQVLWNALLRGEIDSYPDYTGTLRQEMFTGQQISNFADLRQRLAEKNILATEPLGFNNTFAFVMKRTKAEQLGIRTISDLRKLPDLAFGFSNEFMDRNDGWQNLRAHYQLPQTDVKGLDHDLAYRGLAGGSIALTDGYSTDAEIAYYDLQVLEDDRQYFPEYQAVILYRAGLRKRVPQAAAALQKLSGGISDAEMVKMNARAKLDKVPAGQVASDFLKEKFALQTEVTEETFFSRFWQHTVEHLILTCSSLLAAVVVSIPLGICAAKYARLGQFVLGATGIIQTIPSLALLVFMIPFLGIGNAPAIAALFLYSLLPIVRNTCIGLHGIPPQLVESAKALGLSPWARLRLIELPLASRSILAGIKISAVLNIGFATLGALIGAGGYGQPILTGIRLDDTSLILQGAIPAAGLALLAQGIFELLERAVVPKGLRLRLR
jgi:osmoprotectant transport system permease protein